MGELYNDDLGFRYPPVLLKYTSPSTPLHREYGVRSLDSRDSAVESICNFFLDTEDTEKAIDVIELAFKFIDKIVRSQTNKFRQREISPDEAITELTISRTRCGLSV